MLGFEVSWRKLKEIQVEQVGEGEKGRRGRAGHPT